MAYHKKEESRWMTVVETKAFIEQAKSRMTEEEVNSAIVMIAKDPTCGVLIRGMEGVRKVRYRVAGKGKRGGVRIVYYYYNEGIPVFLLTVFAKNEKVDLTDAERKKVIRVVKLIRESYLARRRT